MTAGLDVTGLTVRYGGAVAVDDVTLSAPLGAITGLIGPNGAGKTTTFNACSGLLTPTAGQVSLHGVDITRRPPAARARAGLGRTFQRMELCPSLSVVDNVVSAPEARTAGASVLRQLVSTSARRRDALDASARALELCGIADLASRPVAQLSTGQRRLVELARAVAGGYCLLLLDEPSSGLDPAETEAFGDILVRLASDGELGILLVEHDMALVMRVCEQLFVLDFGKLIFSGQPDAVRASDVVRAAYLGDEAPAHTTVPA